MPGVDHLSICKFATEDDNYKEVLGCLTTMTEYLLSDEVKNEKARQAALKLVLEGHQDEALYLGLCVWHNAFPFAAEMADWPATAPLFVDVGGDAMADRCSDLVSSYNVAWDRVILQGPPAVVANARRVPGVSTMAQDFFEPQQVRNAKFYYLHKVLCDQSDPDARRILTQLRHALAPGAAVLVDEVVEKIASVKYTVPGPLSSKRPTRDKRRTRSYWEELFRSASFQIEAIYKHLSAPKNYSIFKIVPTEERAADQEQ